MLNHGKLVGIVYKIHIKACGFDLKNGSKSKK